MICDVHAHYTPKNFSEFMGDRFASPVHLPVKRGMARHPFSDSPEDIEGRFRLMDEAGVKKQVLSPNHPPYLPDEAECVTAVKMLNDAYAEFATDPEYPDTIACRDAASVPIVSLRTFSKLYGLAGLRVGYAVAPVEVIDALGRVRQPFNVNALALVAAQAALDDHEHVARTLAVTHEGMAYLTAEFDRLGLPWVPSNANFVLVRVGHGGRVYDQLLRRGVITRPMDGYGLPDHLRVSVGLPDENARLVGALEAVLGSGTR